METKRDRNEENRLTQSDVGVAFAAVHAAGTQKKEKSDEEKMSLFWRVFGGTILSIAALVGITIYNNLASTISELRSEISRINEARSELIKKDEFNTRLTTVYERTQLLQTQNNTQNASLNGLQTSLTELKDRLATQKTEYDTVRKDATTAIDSSRKEFSAALELIRKDQTAILDGLKKESTNIELLREQLKGLDIARKDLESIRKDLTAIETLRDKIMMMTAESKELRDGVAKLRQDVERNEAADGERKKSRDEQYTKLLDTMKELDKAARACAEKIARLEGTMAPVTPMAPAKPTGKVAEKPAKDE